MSNIKEFKYEDNIQLTKNTNIKELRCKCSKHHSTKYDLDHINKVQKFGEFIGADTFIYSSGYRCSERDKAVGGSGSGQHTKYNACDICFKKKGKIIPAKEVCCLAQDYGFNGIGYIDKNYVHLDSRTSGTYRGDETKGRSNNVPNGDFYKYFGIFKQNNTYTGTFPKLPNRGYFKNGDKGTEVKKLQKFLNWALNTNLLVDGIIGTKTLNAVAQFQTKVKIKADKLFGKDSLVKAKSYVK